MSTPERRAKACERSRERYHRTPPSVRRAWYEKRKAAGLHWSRDRWLSKTYGITLAQYDFMFQEQGGLCRLCHRPETMVGNGGNVRRLSVDHDHVTGQIRGLLCATCNLGIGQVETLLVSGASIAAIVDYLTEESNYVAKE